MFLAEPGPRFDPDILASAYAKLPESAWRQPVSRDDDVHPGYQFATLVQGRRTYGAASLFVWVLEKFDPVWTAWIAKVPPRGFIGPHIDEGPYHERWHVPIHPAGTFNGLEVQPGVSFPVRHWEPHHVDNPTDSPRVHLVVDRDVWVDTPPARFQRIEVA